MNATLLSTNKTVCPHCGSPCLTVKTWQGSETYREVTYMCTNCEFIFVAAITPIRTLAPSAKPNPHVNIPITTDRRVKHGGGG